MDRRERRKENESRRILAALTMALVGLATVDAAPRIAGGTFDGDGRRDFTHRTCTTLTRNRVISSYQFGPNFPPVILTKLTPRHAASRLSFDEDSQLFAASLVPIGDVSDMRPRGFAALGEHISALNWQIDGVGFEIHNPNDTPCGVIPQHYTVHFAEINRLV